MSLFAETEIQETTHPLGLEEEDGLPEPKLSNIYIGHADIQNRLLKLFNQDKLPHGLIFSGIKGIGKATLAYRLTKFLLAQPPKDEAQDSMFGDLPADNPTSLDTDPANAQVKLFLAGAHPDCKIIERTYDEDKKKQKAHIDIAEIRKIEPFLRMTASNGGWRIVVIDDADTMNRNAQNALLKVLEEPPKKTLIILIAHRMGALIPTIKSRTQHIHFNPLPLATIKELQNLSTMPTISPVLTEIAGGSFGKLQELTEQGGEDTLQTILSILGNYPRWDWPSIHKTADSLSRLGQDQSYHLFGSILENLFWILTQAKARNAQLHTSLQNNQGVQRLIQTKSLHQLIQTTDAIKDHFSRTDFANLDKKSTLLQVISLISE